jgi:hypothetical protein
MELGGTLVRNGSVPFHDDEERWFWWLIYLRLRTDLASTVAACVRAIRLKSTKGRTTQWRTLSVHAMRLSVHALLRCHTRHVAWC